MNKVLIIDTCILCIYLKVPFMDDCGPTGDKWDYERVKDKIEQEVENCSLLVLPLATLIETGNHIAQANGNRYAPAMELAKIMVKAATAEEPWAAFTFQEQLWGEENLIKLAKEWPPLAAGEISIGDATIKDVAEHYQSAGWEVEILTGDAGLKSYEPVSQNVPRRRRNRIAH